MGWKDLSYAKKGAIIGAIIGLAGSLIASIGEYSGLFRNISPDAVRLAIFSVLIPFMLLSAIFTMSGIFGCSWKMDKCYAEGILGSIVTIIIFSLIGALAGMIIGKLKSRKKK